MKQGARKSGCNAGAACLPKQARATLEGCPTTRSMDAATKTCLHDTAALETSLERAQHSIGVLCLLAWAAPSAAVPAGLRGGRWPALCRWPARQAGGPDTEGLARSSADE